MSASKTPLYVVSWGWNDSGRCGNLTASEIRAPQQIQKQSRSVKVIDCCAGKHHSLLLSDEGLVYAIGDGRRGQLGIGNQFSPSNNNNEKPNSALQGIARQATPSGDYRNRCDIRASQIAAGGSFSLSKELSLEEGVDLVPGFSALESSLRRLRNMYSESEALQRAWAQVRHEKFMISSKSSGQVLVWGSGHHGELGLGPHLEAVPFPQPINTFTQNNISIRSIAAGMRHILAIDTNGRIYSWGYGRDGRLGHGDFSDRWVPTAVRFFNSLYVESCAAGDAHSVVVTTTRTGSRSEQLRRISAFGRGAHGRLGNGSNRNAPLPALVSHWLPSLKSAQFHCVSCGGAHTVVLASLIVPVCLAFPFGLQTFVVTWGYGSNGQLGTGRDVDSFVPVKAKMPKSTVIVEVSAGRSWSMARSVAGELFVWGKGLRGQLGLGADKFSFGPRKVEYFASFLKISSNLAHNIGIAVPRKALSLPSAEALARTTHQGYDAFKHIVPLKLRSACSKSFFSFDCCRRSGAPVEAARRPLLRFHCLDCKINCICYQCARLCHRNHRLLDMDKSLFFEAHQVRGAADHDAAAVSSKHKLSLPYTSSIAKLDDYLKHVSIDKTRIEPLSHRCTVLYASNMHLLRPKRGRLEMMPHASSLLDIDPFSMALFTDTEYAEYEQEVQTEALRRSKLKRKVIVIGKRKRHAAVAVSDSESNKSPVAVAANDENRPSLTANKVKGVITTKESAENRRLSTVDAVSAGRGKRQAIESDGKGLLPPARQARRSEFKTWQARGATTSKHQQQQQYHQQQVVAPACHCGLFSRCCRVPPMIPEACEESCVEDTLSVRLECNRDYLSPSIGIRRTEAMKSVSSIDNGDDVRNTRISQRYLRQRIGTRNIAARRIQRLARSFMKKMQDRRSLLRSTILRREVCSRHVTEFIIGAVFKKLDGVYESYRRDKERSYMQYEDHLMHSYDYYTRLQRAIVHIEALLFGTKRMFGSISPKLPRVAIDGRISSAWRPTNAFSWTSIRSQQLHLHPMRRVPVSLLAHVTKHIPRGNHRPSKEGMLADADLTRFTNRFLRSIPYEKWRRRVALLQSEKRERRRLVAQKALEKLKARQNYKKDLLAQAEAISLANQNKVNSAAKPPPGPPPRFVLVQAAEELKRERRQQLERDTQQRLVVEDRDFSVQWEYEQVLHPRRRHTLLDPMQLYSRLTGMRSRMVKSNQAKRRNSLPAQLSSLYVDFQQPTPRLRIAQISESLIMFEERLSSLTSLCTSINGIKASADPAKSLNRCYNHMLKVMSSPVLNPRIPLEMHHTLLDPNRRRSIAEPERLARQLSIMIDTREKFSEAIELSRRSGGLEINRRRRSFDVGERRDSEQGIELILGISYVEQRVATTTTSLINDSEYMNGRMIKAKMVEGDDASIGSASTSVLSNIVTEQDLQIRALQQQMQQPSPADSSYGGASHKKKSISSLAAVRGSPSKIGLSKDQERWGLQVAAVGEGVDDDASITAGTFESHGGGDITPHFYSTLLEEGDSSSSQRVPALTVMDVDPQLYHTWQEHYDAEGRAYYYNAFTDESSWELPADSATQIETQNQDELGNWYWFNSTTGAVVWMIWRYSNLLPRCYRLSMNIRELNVGLIPTKEFEFLHTYHALKHFPTLRRNMREMKLLTMRADSMTQSGLNHSKQQLAGIHFPYGGGDSIGRSTGGASVRSTRVLDDLKKSSLEEIHSLSDYHRILIENRKSLRTTSSDQRSRSGDSSAHRHSSKGPQLHALTASSTPFISDDFSYSTLPSIETNSNTILTRITGGQSYERSVGDDENSTYEQQQHPSSSSLCHNDQSIYDDALRTANAKMTKISTSFNSQNYHSCVRAFQGPLLDMTDFATQLKRCLNINLRAVEVAALFEKMDTRHDGRIDGVEFVRYFFALGTAARWAMQIETVTRNIKREKDLRRQKIEEEERIKVWEAEQILNFTSEDYSSAMGKLEQVALRWSADYDPLAQSGLAGFEAYLTPYRFKLQIEKSFGVRLNGAEIGALTKEFSTRSGEHCIDGQLFLKKFFHVKEVAVRKDNAHKQSNHVAKQKTLSLMRTVDHLPKILGR